ncbi:MAG: hypothetical protein U0V48_18660 [Anaerolineales bacterium]
MHYAQDCQALSASDKTIKVVNDSLDEENEADVTITSASFAFIWI